jgi:hypothetical protein
MLQNEC